MIIAICAALILINLIAGATGSEAVASSVSGEVISSEINYIPNFDMQCQLWDIINWQWPSFLQRNDLSNIRHYYLFATKLKRKTHLSMNNCLFRSFCSDVLSSSEVASTVTQFYKLLYINTTNVINSLIH